MRAAAFFWDGPSIVDGITDIPLPGQPVDCDPGPQQGLGGECGLRHFIVGPENRLVEVAVRAVLEGSPGSYNPLVFYGGSGTGKSHLARGLAAQWKLQHRCCAVYTTGTDFARELAEAINTQAVDDFRAKYRRASLLVFEDIGRLTDKRSGKISAQDELIHTLDALVKSRRWAVLTASAAPCRLRYIMPRLQSRLSEGLSVPLLPPAANTRLSVLQRLAEDRNLKLPKSVAHVLADGLAATVPELCGALLQLDVSSRPDGGSIDAKAARRYLTKRNGSREPSIHEVALATAKFFSLTLRELRSPSRRRAVVTARDAAIYLARLFTHASFDELGEYFGGRDHSTIIHGCRKLEALLETDLTIRSAMEELQEKWKKAPAKKSPVKNVLIHCPKCGG